MGNPSFQADIAPLFVPRDLACMGVQGVRLKDVIYMTDPAGDADYPDFANARHVADRLRGIDGSRMPPGAPWNESQIAMFERWLGAGCPP